MNDQNLKKKQICNADSKKKGEFYNWDDKVFVLGIFKQSRKCYRYLSNIKLSLPKFPRCRSQKLSKSLVIQ